MTENGKCSYNPTWAAKDQSFAELFREARIEKEITLRKISERVGLSIGYLSDIEHKRRNPPAKEIVKMIEEVLGITDGRLSKAALEEYSRTPRGAMETEIASLRERVKELEAAAKRYEFSNAVRSVRSAVRYLEDEKFCVDVDTDSAEEAINLLEVCEILMFESREVLGEK
jgi:transcriptional regulator with XRE-family HTH domain